MNSRNDEGSALLLGETSDCVYFDNEGFYGADQKRYLPESSNSAGQSFGFGLILPLLKHNKFFIFSGFGSILNAQGVCLSYRRKHVSEICQR